MRLLPPSVFGLDVPALRRGRWSDAYFVNTGTVVARSARLRERRVVMQVFQKQAGVVVCGMSEALAILMEGSVAYCAEGHVLHEDPEGPACPVCGAMVRVPELTFRFLGDGSRVGAREPVLQVEGRFLHFAHLETAYLGALSRGTRIATNTARAVEAARAGRRPKGLFFFAARHDHYLNQPFDGYAAHVGALAAGSEIGVSTRAQTDFWGATPQGTMPHALVAVEGGDAVQATVDLAETLWETEGEQVNVIALVDYANDCVATSLAVARAFRERFGPGKLFGVRCDTTENLVDFALVRDPSLLGAEPPTGVSPLLLVRLREALDAEGFQDVRIIASGGFTPERIRRYETSKVTPDGRVVPVSDPAEGRPIRVDGYGIGEGFLQGTIPFTADVVVLDGEPEAKVGRAFIENPRMSVMEWRRGA